MKRTTLAVLTTTTLLGFAVSTSLALAYQSDKDNAKKMQQVQNAGGTTKATIDPAADARYRKAIEPAERSLRLAQLLYTSDELAGSEQAAKQTITLASGLSPLPQAIAKRLIGQIRMKQGRYKEALDYFIPASQNTWQAGINLDVALCYVRVGNVQMAKRAYSDQALLQYSQITVQDLPGTRTPQTLEASILIARGMDKYLSATGEAEAFTNFDAALKLVPKNGLAAFYAAKSLTQMDRYKEAGPYYVKASENGRGKVAEQAKGWATTYLRSKANEQNADQNPAQSSQSRP